MVDCYCYIASKLLNISYEEFRDKTFVCDNIYTFFREDIKRCILDAVHGIATCAMSRNQVNENFPGLFKFLQEYEDKENVITYLNGCIDEFYIGNIKQEVVTENDTYLMVKGQRVEVTQDQVDKIMHTDYHFPFRLIDGKDFLAIDEFGGVSNYVYRSWNAQQQEALYNVANVCYDPYLLQQRALYEQLSRLLWRYSIEHEGTSCSYDICKEEPYEIYVDNDGNFTVVAAGLGNSLTAPIFATRKIAEDAIIYIVKPFMSAHPTFVPYWNYTFGKIPTEEELNA